MLGKFVEFLFHQIEDRKQVCVERILTGRLLESEYKFFTGKLQGIQEAADLIRSAYKNMTEVRSLSEQEKEEI